MRSRKARGTIAITLSAVAIACSTAAEPGAGGLTEGGLRYTAETRVLESFPVQLRTPVIVANPGGRSVRMELSSGCAVQLVVYRTAERTAPVWDQSRVQACTMALQIVDLDGGATRTFEGRTDAREILGDSLPDGTYHISAVMHVNQRRIEVPAGAAQLGVPR